MTVLNNWAIIRASGKVQNIGPQDPTRQGMTFATALDWIHQDTCNGGSSHDSIITLLHNGKEVPLGDRPTAIAYRYIDKRGGLTKIAYEEALEYVMTPKLKEFLDGK